MKPEKFKVIQFIRELIVLIDNEKDSFPKKELEIKNRLFSYSIREVLELETTPCPLLEFAILNLNTILHNCQNSSINEK